MNLLSSDKSFGYILGFTKCMEIFNDSQGKTDGKQKRAFILDKMLEQLFEDKFSNQEIKRMVDRLDLEHWEIAITNIMKNKMNRDNMLKAIQKPDSLFSILNRP